MPYKMAKVQNQGGILMIRALHFVVSLVTLASLSLSALADLEPASQALLGIRVFSSIAPERYSCRKSANKLVTPNLFWKC